MLVASPEEQASITSPPSPMTEHVYAGPQWYRARIRTLGPLLALVVPAALGAVALLALELFDGLASGWTGLVLGVCAAPGLLAIGVPFASTSEYWIGIAISVVLWLVVGVIASRIATRNPVATFSDFWRAYRWLAAGVWIGVGGALLGSSLILGRELL